MVKVECAPAADGWRCEVEVDGAGPSTRHTVWVSREDLERWGGGRPVEDLVRLSFDFLLEREPASSILGRFDLSVIQRYFPDFDHHFRR